MPSSNNVRKVTSENYPTDFRLTMYRQMFYHKDKCCTREMDAFIQLASGPDLPLL